MTIPCDPGRRAGPGLAGRWAAALALGAALVGAGLGAAAAAPGSAFAAPALPGAPAAPRAVPAPPPVRVVAAESPERFGGAVYRYVVINNSDAPVTSVLIGFDQDAGEAELHTPLLGWNGTEAPPTSFTAPDGWHFVVTRAEEDTVFNLAWEIEDPSSSIWSGTRLSGFSVTLPREDTLLETAHWTVIFGTGAMPSLSGRIERAPRQRLGQAEDDPGIHVRHDASWTTATIEYEMDDAGEVEIAILDAGARLVRSLLHDDAHAGKNKVTWDGLDERRRAAGPGSYFVRVRTAAGDRFARFSWLR